MLRHLFAFTKLLLLVINKTFKDNMIHGYVLYKCVNSLFLIILLLSAYNITWYYFINQTKISNTTILSESPTRLFVFIYLTCAIKNLK